MKPKKEKRQRMSSVQKRSTKVLTVAVLAATLTQGCYGANTPPSHVAWNTSAYDLADRGQIQVGYQRTVQEAGPETPGVEFRLAQTPLCAPRQVGQVDLTLTQEKEIRRGLTVPLRLLLLAGSATVAGLGVKNFLNGEKVRGGVMMGTGGLVTFINAVVGTRPATKVVYERETLPVTRISADTATWKTCGVTTPVQSDVLLTFEANGNVWESKLHADAGGVVRLPADLSSDLQSWSQACGTNIRLTASLVEGIQTIDQLRRAAKRLDARLEGNAYFEVGERDAPATDEVRTGPSAGLMLTPGPRLASYTLGDSGAATFARACIRATAEQQHASCIASEKERSKDACEQSCIAPEKREECAVRSEICVEQTAGIAALQADCAGRLNSCLAQVQQDVASVQRCTSTCQAAAATRACSANHVAMNDPNRAR